jgi:hypothetical protein
VPASRFPLRDSSSTEPISRDMRGIVRAFGFFGFDLVTAASSRAIAGAARLGLFLVFV